MASGSCDLDVRQGMAPLLEPLLRPVAIAAHPQRRQFRWAVAAKAREHGIEVASVLLPRQVHQGFHCRGRIEAVLL
jgi:hypothetical protein